jgi:23S rRNA (uracil1939-C5)-methyltransferase
MFERVTELAGLKPGQKAVDVYCGTGSISLCLARQGGTVLGIESSPAAIKDAFRNISDNGITTCRFAAGQAEDLLEKLGNARERFDLAVADPPRAGMHARALSALCELRPTRIVYVSCNPQTLARDLLALRGYRYEVVSVQLVDMLPQTPHCEIVAVLEQR